MEVTTPIWDLPRETCMLNDFFTRGFRIEREMKESRISGKRSGYFKETPVSRIPLADGTPGAVFHDCVADGESAYRAVILGLKFLEEGRTMSTADDTSNPLTELDNAAMLEKAKSLKATMFENMMLAITGVRLHPELDPSGREQESYQLLSDEGYARAQFLDLADYVRDRTFHEPEHLGILANPGRGNITVGWMRAHLSWLAKQDGLWLRFPWFFILSWTIRKHIIIYEPAESMDVEAITPYRSGGFGGLYFDQIGSEVISLLYRRSGQVFLGIPEGEAHDSSKPVYNRFGLLSFDGQHLNAVKSEISKAANDLGIPKERVVFTLQTSDSDGPAGGGGYGFSDQSSGIRNRGSAPPGDMQQGRGPCRALVGRGRRNGPDMRKVCSRLEKDIGSGRCGNHKTADLIPADRMPPRTPNLQQPKCDRTRKGAGEGTESESDDDTVSYYGEKGTPSDDEGMDDLPGIDTVEDQRLILGPLWKLTPVIFFAMFPLHVFQHILDKAGLRGGLAHWARERVKLSKEDGTEFLRCGGMSVMQWLGNKNNVLFLSTANVFIKDTEPQGYPKRQKGINHKIVGAVKQPTVRQTYGKHLRRVDVADHRRGTFFWRHVFEQNLMQAVVKAYILFQRWVRLMNTRVDDRIADMEARGDDDPTIQMKLKARLGHLEKTMMLCWVKAIADHLMSSQCEIGKEEAAGGRGAKKRRRDTGDRAPVKWFGNSFSGPSLCFNRTEEVRFCRRNTRGVCGCRMCREGKKGGYSRTRICRTCCASSVAHERAAIFSKTQGRGGKYKCRSVALPE